MADGFQKAEHRQASPQQADIAGLEDPEGTLAPPPERRQIAVESRRVSPHGRLGQILRLRRRVRGQDASHQGREPGQGGFARGRMRPDPCRGSIDSVGMRAVSLVRAFFISYLIPVENTFPDWVMSLFRNGFGPSTTLRARIAIIDYARALSCNLHIQHFPAPPWRL